MNLPIDALDHEDAHHIGGYPQSPRALRDIRYWLPIREYPVSFKIVIADRRPREPSLFPPILVLSRCGSDALCRRRRGLSPITKRL